MTWRKVQEGDLEAIARDLRPADYSEALDMWGVCPTVVLSQIPLDTLTWVCYTDGPPLGALGIVPTGDPLVWTGWAVFTNDAVPQAIPLMRGYQGFRENLHASAPIIHNYVSVENTLHINWLRFMGFTFISRRDVWGAAGKPFYEFVSIRKE